MAVLRSESTTWPIHSARRLHDGAQLGFMWQFKISDENGSFSYGLELLAQSCSFPGIMFKQKEYVVGGHTQYYTGGSSRGGEVTAKFIEVEGGDVDRFFRTWADSTDVRSPSNPKNLSIVPRIRAPGNDKSVSRLAEVWFIRRNGDIGALFQLKRLRLVDFGGYAPSYDGSGPLIVPVKMVCDDVVRSA